ncbi:MAG: hypothetical protein WAO76_09485 [Georgfuchsia sp.]
MNNLKKLVATACRSAVIATLLGAGSASWAALPITLAPIVPAPVDPVTHVIDMKPGYTPDYFNTPNWAFSPPLTKFVDTLGGVYIAGSTGDCSTVANNLGQYLPVAIPDTTTYPGSDYYEISLVQYREQMHSELPPVMVDGNPVIGGSMDPAATGGTLIRGYVQTNTTDTCLKDKPHFLGPVIIAQKDRPVRVKFTNNLPIGTAGNLPIPVDETLMGAGEYEINYDPVAKTLFENPVETHTGKFTQNRATLHLHGGRTPWISDGTPHQWTTPDAESGEYWRGVSSQEVPDMPAPGGPRRPITGPTSKAPA